MPDNQFLRDASNRLTFEMFRLPADSYTPLCSEIKERFGLMAVGERLGAFDVVFQDYRLGRAGRRLGVGQLVGLYGRRQEPSRRAPGAKHRFVAPQHRLGSLRRKRRITRRCSGPIRRISFS